MINVYINKDKCKGCELCVYQCPKKILELSKDINHLGYNYSNVTDTSKCIGCQFCLKICPDVCIEIVKEIV